MKLLIIYMDKFWYRTTTKTLSELKSEEKQGTFQDVLVGFIHSEKEDEEEVDKKVKKLIKSLKWAAGKNKTKRIVLHSFAHLSKSKADPEVALSILEKAEERLKSVGYEVCQTPFGHFLNLEVSAPGISQARIFQDL
ncbi:MAG: threonyl-tRNA synthetase editing domain-containing protein [Caldisericota bacterium]|nr:threonyl-tRNA synthetase editing domain-containing protein [Caldisericota bacterium]